MSTARMRWVLTRIVSRSEASAAALWPVPCAATRSPRSRAKSTMATTSATVSGSATATGRWSTARFQAWRAASQPTSPGTVTAPISPARSALKSSAVVVVLYILRPP